MNYRFFSIGEIKEVYRQVKAGTREYDPYAIFFEILKKAALEKAKSNG